MADFKFKTKNGETVDRELLLTCLNTGTYESPVWSPLGSRTTDSSIENDWGTESNTDILGQVRTTMKKAVKTQGFDPLPLDGGDAAIVKLHELAEIEENPAALCNLDMLIVHLYMESTDGNGVFAKRYDACAVEASSIGGEGGGNINMPINVTFGGNITRGIAVKGNNGAITFTPETEVATVSTFSTRNTKTSGSDE